MIIAGKKKFITASFSNEAELEDVVQKNSEHIFGPDSIYLPKSLIRTPEGFGTDPDGFVIDLASKTWYIVEAELAVHNVWTHIAPQVAKQMIAATQSTTRSLLTEMVINRVKGNEQFRERLDELGIENIDIRRLVSDTFDKKPIIGIPIDQIGTDLREWAQTLRSEVKLWVVRKLVEFGNPSNVIYEIPEESRPVFDTSPSSETEVSGHTFYDVTLTDLLEGGYLKAHESLFMTYGPRGGERKSYEAIVQPDGTMEVLGELFNAPSYAALLCIRAAGSNRDTTNGWISWRTREGRTLAELRDSLMTALRPIPVTS